MSRHTPPVDWESASAADREVWLEHVDACLDCRRRWLAEDPSRMFALLASEPIPDAVLEDVSTAVAAGIREDARASDPRRVRAWPVAAGLVAAALLLAAVLVPWPGPETGPEVVAPVVALPAADAALPATYGLGVEVLSSPGEVQVVDVTVGETQVVMIFDEDLDL